MRPPSHVQSEPDVSERPVALFDRAAPWPTRLAHIVETMRELSRQTDPNEMVRTYASRMRGSIESDRTVSISRRDLARPWYRITRSSTWNRPVNPWLERDSLPRYCCGALGDLIYADEPRIVTDFRLEPDDPAHEYLQGMRSLLAVPHYDQGVAQNMVVFMRREARGFDPERVPEIVWFNNLFGRATHNLVLSADLRAAYDLVDRELSVVAEIQRSLLPAELPSIPGVQAAAHYQTARRAGGDYYDFFELSRGRWGFLIADVSGHGTPAAVVMAITHTLAHSDPEARCCPDALLNSLNRRLYGRYTSATGSFVTAFYGVYDPATRALTYSCAGHNPPRVLRAESNTIEPLFSAQGLPLGVVEDAAYGSATVRLAPSDALALYTDGITEARAPSGEMFGVQRLDEALLDGSRAAPDLVKRVLARVDEFTSSATPDDDRTFVALSLA